MLSLLFTLLFLVAFGAAWECNPKTTTLDLTNGPVYIPYKSNIAEQYQNSLNCTWKFQVPIGKYASIKILSNFGQQDFFKISNVNGGYLHQYNGAGSDLPQEMNNILYLPAFGGESSIRLTSALGVTAGSLTITVELHDVTAMGPITTDPIGVQLLYPLETFARNPGVFGQETEYVYRLGVVSNDYRYDSCFIYNGKSAVTGKAIVGLSTQTNGVPRRFTGSTTVLCFGTDFPTATLVVSPLPKSLGATSSWTICTGKEIKFALNGRNGAAFLSTYSQDSTVEYLQFTTTSDRNVTISLYSGNPGMYPELRETFSVNDSAIYLPQEMKGEWRTYQATGGMATLGISRSNVRWNEARVGRKGFVASDDSVTAILNQKNRNSTTIFKSSSGVINFSYNVYNINNGYAQIFIEGSGESYSKKVDLSNLLTAVDSHDGTSMTIQLVTDQPLQLQNAIVKFEMKTKSTKSAVTAGFTLATLLLCFMSL